MGYEQDIRLEVRFGKQIKAILGNYFIGQDVEHDRKQATDFEIFTVRPFTVGVRLRTHEYLLKYSDEFTIRWSRPSGVPTEIHKIRDGLVDYILYGFVDQQEQHIEQYFLGDLGVFRANEPQPLCVKPNRPPDSELAAYKVASLPSEFVLHWYRRN
jgi:hypothetical protein